MASILSIRGRAWRPRRRDGVASGEPPADSRRPLRPVIIGVATALFMGTLIGGLTLIEQRAEQNIRGIPVPVRQDL